MSSKLSHGRIRRFCAAVLASFALFATAACGSTTSSKADASASSDGSFPVSISNMPTAPRNSRRHPNASSPSAGGVPPPPDFNPHSPCGGATPIQFGEAVRLCAMLLPPTPGPAPRRRIRAREPAFRHEPLVRAGRGMALLDGHAQIGGRPAIHDGRVPVIDQRPARSGGIRWPGRIIPVVGVPGHGRARYAEPPRYLLMRQTLTVELPDTLSDTHRCRHFLSSREPSVWLTGTRESIKEPGDAGVLVPPAPPPPAMSKLNAQGVQEQVPTPDTFI